MAEKYKFVRPYCGLEDQIARKKGKKTYGLLASQIASRPKIGSGCHSHEVRGRDPDPAR